MREGGAGPAALLGEGGSRPGRRVRGCTLEPVWSTSSEKGDGRALRSRMARLFEGLLLSNFRTIGSLVKPRRVWDERQLTSVTAELDRVPAAFRSRT